MYMYTYTYTYTHKHVHTYVRGASFHPTAPARAVAQVAATQLQNIIHI